jgi:hypothetical protein
MTYEVLTVREVELGSRTVEATAQLVREDGEIGFTVRLAFDAFEETVYRVEPRLVWGAERSDEPATLETPGFREVAAWAASCEALKAELLDTYERNIASWSV